ncbi:MAG: 2-C-methyl-D-erythritol 4-phosphate cytidylyltransferase [Selenomonadaceae bacterium]|nr:2-C-methyl-D-erythritol 4-phosphate cytidylyltransferase [Selenomonadaceae bacterium]
MVAAVIPAAGQGRRMGAGRNKMLLQLRGRPILVWTLLAFSKVEEISELVVVVGENEVAAVQNLLREVKGLKPYQVAAGGAERQYSIANGLNKISPEAEIVLVHDGARPLVSTETIKKVIAAAREHGGAIAAVPEKNTVKVVDEAGFVVSTPDRAKLWAVQTPQGFRRELIKKAYAKAEEDGFLGTDDASLAERIGIPVQVVTDDYRNIKITTPEDLTIAEAFLAAREAEDD